MAHASTWATLAYENSLKQNPKPHAANTQTTNTHAAREARAVSNIPPMPNIGSVVTPYEIKKEADTARMGGYGMVIRDIFTPSDKILKFFFRPSDLDKVIGDSLRIKIIWAQMRAMK